MTQILTYPSYPSYDIGESSSPYTDAGAAASQRQYCLAQAIESISTAVNEICEHRARHIVTQVVPMWNARNLAYEDVANVATWRYREANPQWTVPLLIGVSTLPINVVDTLAINQAHTIYLDGGSNHAVNLANTIISNAVGYAVGNDYSNAYYQQVFSSINPSRVWSNQCVEDSLGKIGNVAILTTYIAEQSPSQLYASEDYFLFSPQDQLVGQPVTNYHLGKAERTIHALRSMGLPVMFSWAAYGAGDGYEAAVPGDFRGWGCTNATRVNLLDPDRSITEYSFNSPGMVGWSNGCGIGRSNYCYVACGILARANAPANVYLLSATGEIFVNVGTSKNWYYGNDDLGLYTNYAHDHANDGNIPKMDIHGRVDPLGLLEVFGLIGELIYR